MKISVIIPVYKVEQYIERCTRSLMEQSLDEVEYIFVNDCTPDRSIDVLRCTLNDYPQRQSWVKIINNECNCGVSMTRAMGQRHAEGDYIIHCDGDDWMELDMLQTLYDTAISKDSDIVYCDFYRSTSATYRQHVSQHCPLDALSQLKGILTGMKQATMWNHLVKRSLYTSHQIMWPKANILEDTMLLFQLCYYAKRIDYVGKPLYNYYINPTSLTATPPTRNGIIKQWKEALENTGYIYHFIEETGLMDELKNEVNCQKLIFKNMIQGAIATPADCKMWINCHPELNRILWTMPSESFKQKVVAITIFLHIYPLIKKVFR